MGAFRLDCPFCDEVIESNLVDTVKDHGTDHLETHHDAALTSVLTKTNGGNECRNCGATFSADDRVDGFECPDCRYDNFQPLVQRYLYWQIETE